MFDSIPSDIAELKQQLALVDALDEAAIDPVPVNARLKVCRTQAEGIISQLAGAFALARQVQELLNGAKELGALLESRQGFRIIGAGGRGTSGLHLYAEIRKFCAKASTAHASSSVIGSQLLHETIDSLSTHLTAGIELPEPARHFLSQFKGVLAGLAGAAAALKLDPGASISVGLAVNGACDWLVKQLMASVSRKDALKTVIYLGYAYATKEKSIDATLNKIKEWTALSNDFMADYAKFNNLLEAAEILATDPPPD